jgi:hypothetical protein
MGRPKTNVGKCKINECEKNADVLGLCRMHYTRIYRHKDAYTTKKVDKYKDELCAIGECGRKAYAKYLCEKHYDQVYRQKKKYENN